MPPYAYAYLLTAVVGPDYSDVDGIQGPSDGDLGNFTQFDYIPQYVKDEAAGQNYRWRTPAVGDGARQARYDRGLRATSVDDKASYSYGEKEVFYLHTIRSKNRIAVFDLDEENARLDAHGVREDGTTDPAQALRRLRTIGLYDKKAYLAYEASLTTGAPLPEPEAIVRVHFEYDYLLCKGTPNSMAPGKKKLTLTKVYFTYGRSHRGTTTAYTFNYGDLDSPVENPDYDLGSQDRWGNVKPDRGSPMAVNLGSASHPYGAADYQWAVNADFPYAEQNPGLADALAGAWCLKHIGLPSGGGIDVQYESDDYAFVQGKRAARMFKIIGNYRPEVPDPPPPTFAMPLARDAYRMYFKLPTGARTADVLVGQDLVYFRQKMHYRRLLNDLGDDHVSGYGEIIDSGEDGPGGFGWVEFKGVKIDEGATSAPVSPLERAALEYARLNYPNEIYAPPGYTDGDTWTIDLITSIAGSLTQLITDLGDFFKGPNLALQEKVTVSLVQNDGWLRLTDPTQHKKGGGHRVARVVVHDEWADMETRGGSVSRAYTQRYEYTEGAASSGVATYEPMGGADENPMRKPVYSVVTNALAADERFYQEEPFGESFFPAPVVGYSKVTVSTEIADPGVASQQGTGRVVHRFYTAHDFPVRTAKTDIDQVHRKSPPVFGSLIGITTNDQMYVSQGFVVETNDMHGKPRSVEVFPQDGTSPISSTQYEYQRNADGTLDNDAPVDPSGWKDRYGRHRATIRVHRGHAGVRERGKVRRS
ncbi:MAG: hypothetical protein QM724_13395 [Flavobacteriales bacterium]